MTMREAWFGRAVATLTMLVAVPAAGLAQPWLDEVRIGDTVGQAYDQFVHLEALFAPLSPGPTYIPSWLLSPRPFVGATISTQGKTDELFGGVTWSAPVAGPFLLEGSFGGAVHNQSLFVAYPDRPELTTRFLFRESIAAGYQITPQWRVLVNAEHEMNGNLGYLNHGVNRVGLELGRKFGDAAAPSSPPPASAPFSWAGAYFGVSAGIAEATSSIAVTYPPAANTFAGQTSKSLIVGGQAGYNWTFGDFVAGVEGDISALSLHTGADNVNVVGPYAVNAQTTWLATARLRAGFDLVQFPFMKGVLIYGTGGAAFANMASTFCINNQSCFNGSVAPGWSTQYQVKTGWTAGAGIEAPLAPHVTGKLEYLYVDIGAGTFYQGAGTYVPKFTEQGVRAGLNFLFPAY